MKNNKKLAEVFKTVGLPPYTYVKPLYYGEVRADVEQPGKHLLIEGPSGIGKTCIVYKVFSDLDWESGSDFHYISCRDSDYERALEDFLSPAESGRETPHPILVVDDFHFISSGKRSRIGSRLKRISDRAFETNKPPKLILIGIPTAGVSLLSEAYDLGPRLGVYRLERATDTEVRRLINEGENALNIIFEDEEILLSEISGNFWLGQFICNKVCASQEIYGTQPETKILSFDLLGIRRRLMAELSPKYATSAVTFCKGKKWRPGGNKPYLEVLIALSKIPESVVSFDKILNLVPERRRPGIKAIRQRISEVIHNSAKKVDLRKQIIFDPQSGFSIEDPLFRYYLSNLDLEDLYKLLGVESTTVEEGKIYSYDVGFSFAGEVRQIVEAVNEQLKREDVVTFYDFDQQAMLLAENLEDVLQKVYTVSCRYYLIFLDKTYKEKIWPRFEKDTMTTSGRSGHIIPIILDNEGDRGLVGISRSKGHIDLREIWSRISKAGHVTDDDINQLRNRCVIPVIEKLDDTHQLF